MEKKKRICVIGAGPSGITAIKCCREEDLDVQCYEKSNGIGGLWRYHESDEEGQPSVMKSTIINTSKEMSSYSDFPPPKNYANFMHNTYMYQYFKSYAEHFDVIRHIKFHHEVFKIEKNDDYDVTGKWIVSVTNLVNRFVETEVFDGVTVCVGHHIYPNIPTFSGLQTFKGKVMHTHSLKTASGFENMRVLVVGVGNSGVDAAVEMTHVAKQVYLSTRRGSWIFPRVSFFGMPLDILLQRRIFELGRQFNYFKIFDTLLELFLNERFSHAKYKLKPKHRVLSSHPTINDALPNGILSGRIIIKQDIDRFEENSVFFKEEETATEIDALILATGYNIKYPFLGEDILKIENNNLGLYKFIFPPRLPHPSLAFIGLIQAVGALFPVAEAQSRWYALLIQNKLKLPCTWEMEEEIVSKQKAMAERYVASPRHTIQEYYIPYMDDICSEFGAKPNLCLMAFTDPKLFFVCLFGPCTSYQYRLQGPHTWEGARDAVLSASDRIDGALNTCKRD